MHIKDALQSLVDDSLIRVEKIGSGNWYWSFVGDERKRLQGTTKVLVEERDCLRKVIEGLKMTLDVEKARVRNEGGRTGEEVGRLVEEAAKLRRDKEALEIELESYRDGDPMEVERRRKLVEEAKVKVNRNTGERLVLVDLFRDSMRALVSTKIVVYCLLISSSLDNIYTLLSYFRQSCGGDKETMQYIWNEYLEGAGEGGGEGELEYAE